MNKTKIAVTGPESTGKSTLSKSLAQTFQATWVPEFARIYLEQLDRPYCQQDLLEIARGQLQAEHHAQSQGPVIICDTDLTVIKIWSEFKYNNCHPWIRKRLKETTADLYLLTYPDLAWEPDPQRENPGDRHELFELYRSLLLELEVDFVVIKGKGNIRYEQAKKVLKSKLY